MLLYSLCLSYVILSAYVASAGGLRLSLIFSAVMMLACSALAFAPKAELKAFVWVVLLQCFFLLFFGYVQARFTHNPLLVGVGVGTTLIFLEIFRRSAKVGSKDLPIHSWQDIWLLGWTAGGCMLIGLSSRPILWFTVSLAAISAPHVMERIQYIAHTRKI